MRPAFSVLFLTTLIGIGQGLLLALVTGQWYFVIGAAPTQAQESGMFYAVGSGLALVFMGLGLIASFFHLANPQRAWRTIARWRSSWLSREVIVLPAVMGLGAIYGGVHYLGINPVIWTFSNQKSLELSMAVGFLVAGAALLLFVCTGMIYACVKFIREWASSWTVINFTLMGMSSGFTVAATYAALVDSPLAGFLVGDAFALTVIATLTRFFQHWRNGRIRHKSSMATAIGVHHPQIRQLTQGFCGTSFNITEFRHSCTPETVRALAFAFLVFGFGLPALLILAGWHTGEVPFLLMAVMIQYVGLLTERWVFFAQGNHVQNLYYQRAA